MGELNGYIAFYGDGRFETHAATLYEAHQEAVKHFAPPKSRKHLVHTHLAEKDGKPVVHVAVD